MVSTIFLVELFSIYCIFTHCFASFAGTKIKLLTTTQKRAAAPHSGYCGCRRLREEKKTSLLRRDQRVFLSSKMSKLQQLRLFVNERLTAAAEEIFGAVERTILEFHTDKAFVSQSEDVKPNELLTLAEALKAEEEVFPAGWSIITMQISKLLSAIRPVLMCV